MKHWIVVLFILTLGIIIAPSTSAQELPDFVVKAVAQVTAYYDYPYTDENKVHQGSGVFVDHGGCLYTNSHVVLDLERDEVYDHIVVSVTEDRGLSPEQLYVGGVVYVEQAVDLAYICPQDDTGVFTHFFERAKESRFATVPFGKSVWIMGYPAAGIDTITISPGHIVGFLKNPAPENWVGVPDLNPDLLTMYKTDALSGPGVSGGLLVDEDLRLLGVPFAGSFNPGAFIFTLTDEVYLGFEKRLRLYLHQQDLVPTDCVFDTQSDYYYRGGLAHYDDQCEMPYDEVAEHEIKQTYQAFCGKEISSQRLIPAVRRSKELGDYSKWSDDLILICPQVDETITDETPADVGDLTVGTFAYGKARLVSLETEQSLAVQLKAIIDAKYPQLQIDADDWSTIVNSYIYGGYPVSAINKAIELGGYTVHPEIPYSAWQGSSEYQEYIQ